MQFIQRASSSVRGFKTVVIDIQVSWGCWACVAKGGLEEVVVLGDIVLTAGVKINSLH